jgi:putative chitinase
MELTLDKLKKIMGNNQYVEYWYQAFEKILPEYEIDSVPRIAAFLAQCGHESGNFTALQENLNYKAESLMCVWPKYFHDIDTANHYAHKPEMIANRAYANRMGNGPEETGDGWKFCGRGLIQLTGKSNYQAFAESLEMDLEEVPAYLGTFEGAIQSACWFWEANNLNKFADSGDIKGMTKVINGGYLGLEDREKHYHHAIEILSS